MGKGITKILVETAVRRTVKNLKKSPEREARNLVDLGLQLSTGRFQKRLFMHAQTMLKNQNSAYYTLIKNTAMNVDEDNLVRFSINLGYNSCTKGAKLIRQTEAERHYNIPWVLNLAVNEEKLTADPDFYPSILRQGKALGIYTYLLFFRENPEKILSLVKNEPDCAFIIFLKGKQIKIPFLEKMQSVKNVMISIRSDSEMPDACHELHDARILYSVHYLYDERDTEYIINNDWIKSILPFQPNFALLLSSTTCSSETQQTVYQYVTDIRELQKYPVICMDIKQDSLMIDHIISEGECLAGFDFNGDLRTHKEILHDPRYNINSHSLEEILKSYS